MGARDGEWAGERRVASVASGAWGVRLNLVIIIVVSRCLGRLVDLLRGAGLSLGIMIVVIYVPCLQVNSGRAAVEGLGVH